MQQLNEEMRQKLAVWWAIWDRIEITLREIEKRANSEFLKIVTSEKGFVLAEEIRKARSP